MGYLFSELGHAIPLITHGDAYIFGLLWVTLKVAAVSTAIALAIGLPLGLTIGLGRFRGRRALHILANASLALPPVIVGLFLLLLLLPAGVFGSLHIAFTLKAVYVAQTILALPYIVALTPAAIQGLPPGLLAQARALGAGRVQLSALALREAKLGVLAAVIAALGSALSEVGAVVMVGGNIQNYDQTLASAVLQQVTDYNSYPYAIAIGIVLLALIVLLIGGLTVVQQRAGGLRLRFRTA
ncbi:MAG TPA: ABC transporter permease [Solirubrobacteraceae bacterium]|jgi:tungstate transport system permease protein|nr:ABC transporter permease [Solirubrobacteraceae bacterium]